MPQSQQSARWAVALLFFVNGLVLGSWAPQIPVLVARLGISELTLGTLLLCFGLGALSFMPLSGWLISRQGSRSVALAFAAVFIFALPAISLIDTLWLAYPVLFLFGGLSGAMDVSMNANAAHVERRLSRAIMSSSHGFWSLGGFSGAALGGIAIETLGASGHAFLVGIIAAGLLAAAWRTVAHDKPAPYKSKFTRSFARSPVIYALGLIALLSMVPEGAILSWSALYLRQELGADIVMSGWAFAAFSGMMAAMRFMGDSVRNRFGAVTTLRVSSLVAATGLVVAGLSPSAWPALVAFAVAGLGIANMVPIAFSAAGNRTDIASGTGVSFVATMGYSGTLAAPSLIGFIAERTGFSFVYLGFGLVMVVIFAMAGLTRSADVGRTSS